MNILPGFDSSGMRTAAKSLWLLRAACVLAWFAALAAPAQCTINGPAVTCVGTTNTYTASSSITNADSSYTWLITNENAGVIFPFAAASSTVEVVSVTNGTFFLQCTVALGTNSETCVAEISVLDSAVSSSPITNQVTCPNNDVSFQTEASSTGPITFVWRKDGVPLAWATTNSITLTNVTSSDAGSYCVEVSGSCNSVTNCATLSVVQPADLACPTNLVVNCPSDVPAPDPGTVLAPDATNVIFAGDLVTTNNCGLSIQRTYQAVNSCGTTSSCTQLIVVANTNPPILVCASNLTVECGASWDFVPPTVSDFCGGTNVTVVIESTVTNQLVGSTFSATRTWRAIDSCSNSVTCAATVTIVDTTPPVISCSSNLVIECAGTGGNTVSFAVTATDVCDTNVSVVCTPQSGSFFSFGTNVVHCIATDASGNTNACSFTVTVRDTTPPQILCPTNMNVAEAPRDSGLATNVNFESPTVADVCDASPLVYCVPPSGSDFAVGTNTVTCTTVDHSGNTNTCSFTVRVIPYRLHVTVTSTADSGPGTLRQAFQDANDSPDANLVVFNIPGTGPKTIHLLSALPEQTSPVIIDGWSQPGFAGTPLIELDGSMASNAIDGVAISAGNSTVRGLNLHGFATAIRLEEGGNNIVQGNFIGTDLTGTNALANSADGILVTSSGNQIGGCSPGVGNVVSGNASNGIVLASSNALQNVVEGNLIGVGADGVTPMGNGLNGIYLADQATQSIVGGVSNGCGNVMAFNGRNGIALAGSAGTGNLISGNSIFANQSLGIDLGDDGVTPNDADDSDTGPNNLQNFPVITDAQSINGVTTIYGQLTTSSGSTYRLEFFLNDAADPSGYGEGQVFLGSTFVSVHGSGAQSFTVSFPVSATYTQFVTATATGPLNDTSEFSQAVKVRTPPVLGTQPLGTNAPTGTPATFCASAVGTPPIFYQWRLNGFNIPGATNACYTISAAEQTNGGTYTVVVGNALGALATFPVSLTLPLPFVPGADFFSNRVVLQGLSGTVAGQNRNATFEPGEPLHAGKVGGKSVWYTWQAPVTGVATFTTRGSTFNTLLAIYSGTVVSNLTAIDSDRNHGGFYTSKAEFNAINGNTYQIAIDGLGGDEGDYILSWSEQDTPHLQPRFWVQPQSQTVAQGSNVTFTAVAVRVCGEGHENCPDPSHYPEGTLPGLSYQWYFFGNAIAGASTNNLTIPNVQPDLVGTYTLQVSTLWQTNQSAEAYLQINFSGQDVQQVQAVDQFLDIDSTLVIGTTGGAQTDRAIQPYADTVVRGYTGTQVFNTTGSATSPGEIICGVIGGASEWLSFVPEASGMLFLNTDGSSYDTVMAVYTRSPTNISVLQLLACDNNSGTNGLTSSLSVPVNAGVTNYIVVDGVNGVSGVLQLNYSLATQTILRLIGITPAGEQHLQVLTRTNLHFAIQGSTDLASWTTLISTNAPGTVFDFIDSDSVSMPRRYYRALLLP